MRESVLGINDPVQVINGRVALSSRCPCGSTVGQPKPAPPSAGSSTANPGGAKSNPTPSTRSSFRSSTANPLATTYNECVDKSEFRAPSVSGPGLCAFGLIVCSVLTLVGCSSGSDTQPGAPATTIASDQEPGSEDDQPQEKQDTVSLLFSDDEEIARWRKETPFITLEIGPYRVGGDTPWLTDGRLYVSSGGDADGWHSYVYLAPVTDDRDDPNTEEDLSSWKTEHGFGYGSSIDEVVSLIGEPTGSTQIENLYSYTISSGADIGSAETSEHDPIDAYIYRWEYPTEIDEGPRYTAVYTLTIFHEGDKVTGLIIDVEEAP